MTQEYQNTFIDYRNLNLGPSVEAKLGEVRAKLMHGENSVQYLTGSDVAQVIIAVLGSPDIKKALGDDVRGLETGETKIQDGVISAALTIKGAKLLGPIRSDFNADLFLSNDRTRIGCLTPSVDAPLAKVKEVFEGIIFGRGVDPKTRKHREPIDPSQILVDIVKSKLGSHATEATISFLVGKDKLGMKVSLPEQVRQSVPAKDSSVEPIISAAAISVTLPTERQNGSLKEVEPEKYTPPVKVVAWNSEMRYAMHDKLGVEIPDLEQLDRQLIPKPNLQPDREVIIQVENKIYHPDLSLFWEGRDTLQGKFDSYRPEDNIHALVNAIRGFNQRLNHFVPEESVGTYPAGVKYLRDSELIKSLAAQLDRGRLSLAKKEELLAQCRTLLEDREEFVMEATNGFKIPFGMDRSDQDKFEDGKRFFRKDLEKFKDMYNTSAHDRRVHAYTYRVDKYHPRMDKFLTTLTGTYAWILARNGTQDPEFFQMVQEIRSGYKGSFGELVRDFVFEFAPFLGKWNTVYEKEINLLNRCTDRVKLVLE